MHYRKTCSFWMHLSIEQHQGSTVQSSQGTRADSISPEFIGRSCFLTTDKSLHVSQRISATSNMGVDNDRDEPKPKMLSPVSDCSTLDELQQLIDLSYQNAMAHEISFTQATDSSTPLKSRSVDSPVITFKKNMEECE